MKLKVTGRYNLNEYRKWYPCTYVGEVECDGVIVRDQHECVDYRKYLRGAWVDDDNRLQYVRTNYMSSMCGAKVLYPGSLSLDYFKRVLRRDYGEQAPSAIYWEGGVPDDADAVPLCMIQHTLCKKWSERVRDAWHGLIQTFLGGLTMPGIAVIMPHDNGESNAPLEQALACFGMREYDHGHYPMSQTFDGGLSLVATGVHEYDAYDTNDTLVNVEDEAYGTMMYEFDKYVRPLYSGCSTKALVNTFSNSSRWGACEGHSETDLHYHGGVGLFNITGPVFHGTESNDYFGRALPLGLLDKKAYAECIKERAYRHTPRVPDTHYIAMSTNFVTHKEYHDNWDPNSAVVLQCMDMMYNLDEYKKAFGASDAKVCIGTNPNEGHHDIAIIVFEFKNGG